MLYCLGARKVLMFRCSECFIKVQGYRMLYCSGVQNVLLFRCSELGVQNVVLFRDSECCLVQGFRMFFC